MEMVDRYYELLHTMKESTIVLLNWQKLTYHVILDFLCKSLTDTNNIMFILLKRSDFEP
jgi:hypothetical protein